MTIRRHSGLLPSNWAFLGFVLCSSSNKFTACLLTASDHSVYHSALVNVNMAEVERVTTYHFHPKLGKIIFLFIRIQNRFVWSAMQQQRWKVREFGAALLNSTKELRKGFSCQSLYVPQKCGIWKCSFNTAVSFHQNPERRATFALCRVSHVLARHDKPFKDGNIVKEAFLKAADSLFEHFKNRAQIMKAIKEVELPRNTRHAKE